MEKSNINARAKFTCVSVFITSLFASSVVSADTFYVDPRIQYQTHEGFGTSLSWFGNIIGGWSDENRNEIAKLLFDPNDGLGLNVVRYEIGAGENPFHNNMRVGTEIPSFKPEQGYWTPEADKNQIWFLEQAKQYAGDHFVADAVAKSPPYWMTISGSTSGNEIILDSKGNPLINGNLSPENYSAYIDYLTDVIDYFKFNKNITFKTIAPTYQPDSENWQPLYQEEGNGFSSSSQAELLNQLNTDMNNKWYLDTTISSSDEADPKTAVADYENVRDASRAANSQITQINTQGYSESATENLKLRNFSLVDRKNLWMSEFSTTGEKDFEPYDPESGLDLAGHITRALKNLNSTAYLLRQAVENWPYNLTQERKNRGLIVANFEGAGSAEVDNHLHRDTDPSANVVSDIDPDQSTRQLTDEDWRLTKKYRIFAHYSKYIRPGYTRINVNDPNGIAYFDKNSNRLVIVSHNDSNNTQTHIYRLENFDLTNAMLSSITTSETVNLEATAPTPYSSGNSIIIGFPAKSVKTIIVDGATYQLDLSAEDTRGQVYYDAPIFDPKRRYRIMNSFTGKVLSLNSNNWTSNNVGIAQYPDYGIESQRWHIVANGEITDDQQEGIYHIVNAFSGKVIEMETSSLEAGRTSRQTDIDSGTSRKKWILDRLGDDTYQIRNLATNMLLDIEDSSRDDGALAVQEFSSDEDSQNWVIVPDNRLVYHVDIGDETPTYRELEERDFIVTYLDQDDSVVDVTVETREVPARTGDRNSVEDQAYGPDLQTRSKWGALPADEETSPNTYTYKFEVDNATDYQVALDLEKYWAAGTKFLKVTIEGEEQIARTIRTPRVNGDGTPVLEAGEQVFDSSFEYDFTPEEGNQLLFTNIDVSDKELNFSIEIINDNDGDASD